MLGIWGVVNPVSYNEGHASNHEDDPHHKENQSPDLLGRPERLFLDKFKIKNCWKNENQHSGGRCPNEPKDVFYSWYKDDQDIIKCKKHGCNQEMSYPAEGSSGK